jgi:hypothetical protein
MPSRPFVGHALELHLARQAERPLSAADASAAAGTSRRQQQVEEVVQQVHGM